MSGSSYRLLFMLKYQMSEVARPHILHYLLLQANNKMGILEKLKQQDTSNFVQVTYSFNINILNKNWRSSNVGVALPNV